LKILLFADLHFHPHEVMAVSINGENSRVLDAISVLNQIKDYAITHNIKHIACLGDFFHSRKKIDVDIYNQAYSLIEEFAENGLSFILLAGNHDLYYKNSAKVTSLRPLSKFAQVINTPNLMALPNANILFVPYYEKIDKLTEVISSYNLPNTIYFLHAEYKGAYRAKISKDAAKRGIDASIFGDNVNRVFMGHYHMQQKFDDKIMYLGSPLQITMREILEDKFFYEFDTDTLQLTPIRTNAARFAVIEYPSGKVLRYCDPSASIEKAIIGNYVEVITFENIKKSSSLYKLLQSARNYVVTNKVKRKDINGKTATGDGFEELDYDALCDKYLKDHPHETLSIDFLATVRKSIIKEVV
jgi:DNA repair exonuclease SbcCD nuclease subunit